VQTAELEEGGLTCHMVSYKFVGIGHNRLIQCYQNGQLQSTEILSITTLQLQDFSADVHSQ